MRRLLAVLLPLVVLVLAPAPAFAAESHSERILFDGGGSESLNGITYTPSASLR